MTTQIIQFPNDGYIRGSLDTELFNDLLEEAVNYHSREIRITGVKKSDGSQTCPHYDVSDESSKRLEDFFLPYITHFREHFNYIQSLKFLNSDSPFVFDTPWFNIQKPNDYLPVHNHQGVLSYTVWLQLPVSSEFVFSYLTITGRPDDYRINLTPENNGEFILFPATLNHAVYPYNSDDSKEIRISLSGNISLQGIGML